MEKSDFHEEIIFQARMQRIEVRILFFGHFLLVLITLSRKR